MIMEFQPPCYVQGRQSLDQAAQSHIQPGLECLQGWVIHNLLGQSAPVCHHPLSEKLPPKNTGILSGHAESQDADGTELGEGY